MGFEKRTQKNSKEFRVLTKIFSYHYQHRRPQKPLLYYPEFKKLIVRFVENLMNCYLETTSFDVGPHFQPHCEIVDFKGRAKGSYHYDTIKIDELSVWHLYQGNLLEFLIPCHELLHFKYDIDLVCGTINQDVIRILKESLIALDALKSKKGLDYSYYQENYGFESSEKVANIEGIKLFRNILHIMNITLQSEDEEKLTSFYQKNRLEYQNYFRDFRKNMRVTQDYMDFEEAFDQLFFHHPSWYHFKQLRIEYKLDKKGNIRKRTREELLEQLKEKVSKEKKNYIISLLSQEKEKKNTIEDFAGSKSENAFRKDEILPGIISAKSYQRLTCSSSLKITSKQFEISDQYNCYIVPFYGAFMGDTDCETLEDLWRFSYFAKYLEKGYHFKLGPASNNFFKRGIFCTNYEELWRKQKEQIEMFENLAKRPISLNSKRKALEKMLEQEKTSPDEMVDYSLRKCYEEMRTCSRKVDFNKKFGALDVKKKIKQIEKKIQ